jgi:pimeloyl-ACP methyl ester carboxylesterase
VGKAPSIRFLRDSQGHSVAYAVHGEGPLVICPVWWVSHVEKDWGHEPFRRFFERLGKGLCVVRYDRPGVGLSDRQVRSRTFADEVALLGEVADALGDPAYGLFAFSRGGPLAIRHTIARPGRVTRICFYGSFLDGQDICALDIQEAVIAVVRAHWGLGSRALADIFLPDEARETIDAFARQTRDASTSEMAEELLRLTYRMKSDRDVAAVKAECLVLHRSGDKAIPFEAGRTLASRIGGARLVTLPGRAHPPWINGDAIADLANAFFLGRRDADVATPVPTGPSAECVLDEANRCLCIEGRDVALTPLEFGVMREVVRSQRQVVSRDELLERVWKQPFEGSNRIDAVISSLRKKLGVWSASIETVTGHGYRFSEWQRRS